MPGGRDFSTLGSHGFSCLKKEGGNGSKADRQAKEKNHSRLR